MVFVITRKINNKEYYLENIHHDKVVWTTDRHNALEFHNKRKLEYFISKEFPGKDYYASRVYADDNWPTDVILKP